MKAALVRQSTGKRYEYIMFVRPTGNGVWQGTVPIDAPAGNDYILLIKGPQHLQKKICSGTIEEIDLDTVCNSATFAVQNQENRVDMSRIPLFAGDIQGEGITQDGVIDASDIAYIRNNFGTTSPTIVSQVDLNFDGVVDTQDYSLVLLSLDYRVDEE